MVDFDPERTWAAVEARLAAETDPRRRALVDEPRYHFWGLGEDGGPTGREAVETFYRNMLESGGNRFHFEVERIVVDADGVVTEGRMRQPMAGADGRPIGEDIYFGSPPMGALRRVPDPDP